MADDNAADREEADRGGTDTSGTDTSGTDTSGTDTSGTDTAGTDTAGTDTAGTDTAGTDTAETDTAETDTAETDRGGFDLSGVRTGPLQPGERVTLTDAKGRRRSIKLRTGAVFQTARGGIAHDDLIGGPDGVVVTSELGADYLALRPLLGEFTVTMPRGAAIVYPKDAAHIIGRADVFPGARVVEAGAGSGALSCALLRAVGPTGRLISYERRADFAEIAERNVTTFFGARPVTWELRVDDLATGEPPGSVDRVILDMVAPWECVDVAAEALVPGGVLCSYVATVTQLGRVMDTIRAHTGYTEPEATELIVRDWHAEGLAIRPGHAGIGHTGFLVFARRLAPGVVAPARKRRPAAGAYGPDYTGPRPPGVPAPAD